MVLTGVILGIVELSQMKIHKKLPRKELKVGLISWDTMQTK